MTSKKQTWIGLDVGGANLKIAHESGICAASPFAVWKNPDGLPEAIRNLAASVPPASTIALTMTAELCDCFPSKREGVLHVLSSVESALPGLETSVWGVDQRFHVLESIRYEPLLAAASNWMALACCIARRINSPTILIDVGSTTTDINSLYKYRLLTSSTTDTERLRSGELVYVGVRRTPICALASEVPWKGESVGLVAELFATTLDVYITLGETPEDPLDRNTADGGPASRAARESAWQG